LEDKPSSVTYDVIQSVRIPENGGARRDLIQSMIQAVQSGRDLSAQEMQQTIQAMLLGQVDGAAMGSLLLALRNKGESVSELAGAARALRQQMTPIASTCRPLLDTCGTGGDGTKSFNISTAAALVAAAAGANVAKHGNRKITSASGSADVLGQLGIRIDAPRPVVERCLEELGIAFCFAPLLHPAMKQVAEVRRGLGVPTLFNYLGPLCNPAGATHQILGVGKAVLQDKMADALGQLGIQRALVVRGLDGMDEISLCRPTRVVQVEGSTKQTWEWLPEDFGLPTIRQEDLMVEGVEQSALVIRQVLAGELGPARDIVVANAAAGVWIVGLEPSIQEAVGRCQEAIDSGRALQILHNLARLSHS
jgi:anthranilate phosphoribosyltransferase